MRLLIVEDDDNKRDNVVAFVHEMLPSSVIELAKSYQTGLRAILKGGLNLAIIDMAMPTFDRTVADDGGRPQVYAGREILRQLTRRRLVVPCIVCTQFDVFGDGSDALRLPELDKELHKAHPRIYVGAVYYEVAAEGWKTALADRIRTALAGKGDQI